MKLTSLDQAARQSILSRAKQWKHQRSLWFDLGLMVLLALLLAAVNNGILHKHSGSVKASNAVPAAASAQHNDFTPKDASAGTAPLINAAFRPLNFALLRGGFTSVDEFFERVNEDPILHSFYGDCGDRNAGMHPLPEDITVFTTFRKAGKIKWSQKPLLVRKGEYVMTFCGKTVLARCGNLISMAPMQPSEDIPPALLEAPADVAVPPLSYAPTTTAEVVTPEPVTPVAADRKKGLFFFIPPFYVPPGGSHSSPPPLSVVPPPASVPPVSVTPPPPSGPPPTSAPPPTPAPPPTFGPPPPPPPSVPPPTAAPPPVVPPPFAPPPTPAPPPPSHLSGDEFSGHQGLFTLLLGLFAIGLVKLVTR